MEEHAGGACVCAVSALGPTCRAVLPGGRCGPWKLWFCGSGDWAPDPVLSGPAVCQAFSRAEPPLWGRGQRPLFKESFQGSRGRAHLVHPRPQNNGGCEAVYCLKSAELAETSARSIPKIQPPSRSPAFSKWHRLFSNLLLATLLTVERSQATGQTKPRDSRGRRRQLPEQAASLAVDGGVERVVPWASGEGIQPASHAETHGTPRAGQLAGLTSPCPMVGSTQPIL